ncbi:hypothetical protein BASA81_015190 [Batrachochytrium salamandrivorans]|nr:hypothetical protein BASA81_015190 [Batrachochytrium salamandrivorans]
MATGDKQARAKLFADLRAARDFVLFSQRRPANESGLSGPVEAPVMPPRLADHMKPHRPAAAGFKRALRLQCSPQDYLPWPCVHDAVVEDRGGRVPNVFPLAQLHRPQVYQAGHHTRHPAPALKDLRVGREIQASQGYHRQQRCCLEERVPSGAEMFLHPGEQQVRVRPHHADRRDRVLAAVEREGRRRRKKRLARKRELLALPKDLKRVRPEPSAKRAELYVAPTGSSRTRGWCRSGQV